MTIAITTLDCAACGMLLADPDDARTGLDRSCRAQLGYRKISSLSDEARDEANDYIHAIAQNRLRGDELRIALFRLYELGFVELAQRIEKRTTGARSEKAQMEDERAVESVKALDKPKVEIEFEPPPEPVRPLPFTPTQGQEQAIEAVRRAMSRNEHSVTVIVGYAGTGKAQPLTASVYTPSGPRAMGDIRTGDLVCTPRGGRARVLGVFPQGKKPTWRLTLGDGAKVEACEDHLWVVKDRTRSSNLRKYKTDTRKLTTRYIVDHVQMNTRGSQRFYLPVCAPLDFDSRVLPIDPYLLGVLLGDGTIGCVNGVSLSCEDRSPLIAAVDELLKPWGQSLRRRGYATYAINGDTPRAQRGRERKRPFRRALEDLGLWGTRSDTKFLPTPYWYGDVSQRRAVLQGLMDTDGTVGKNGVPAFCSVSKALTDAVVWLVRSLGGRATVHTKQPRYTHKGKRHTGKLAYVVNISLDDTHQLFRLERKRIRCHARAFPVQRVIQSVEFLGAQDVQCILVDDPDHLYVTDGVVPTHNTSLIVFLAHAFGTPAVITPTGKAALRVREATGLQATTIHRLIYQPVEDPRTGVTTFVRRTADEIEQYLPRSRLLVLDEASMVGPDVWTDVITVAKQHDIKLVLIGDGFQLPPVQPKGAPKFSVLDPVFAQQLNAARVEMTEVLRQAQGSPIIRASMGLRMGHGKNALREIQEIQHQQIANVCLAVHQQKGVTICHTNMTRHGLNAGIRQMLGIYDEMPQAGEPLMVLRNTYEAGLVNGETTTFPGWSVSPEEPELITDRYNAEINEMARFGAIRVPNDQYAQLGIEDGKVPVVVAVEEMHGRLKASVKAISFVARRWARLNNCFTGGGNVAPHLPVNFGYAYTGHRAQGSQWPFVFVIIEPSIRVNEEEGARWVYTSLTRASEMAAIFWGKVW